MTDGWTHSATLVLAHHDPDIWEANLDGETPIMLRARDEAIWWDEDFEEAAEIAKALGVWPEDAPRWERQ